MEGMKLILVFFLILIIIGLPILGSVFGYKWLKRKGYKKAAFGVPVLIIGILFYLIYNAVYPGNNFYVQDFEKNTGILFPSSGRIIKKDATYPDIHGHYSSRAIIEFSTSDYLHTVQTLQSDAKFKTDTSRFHFLSETLDFFKSEEINGTKFSSILVGGRNAQFTVGFLKDGKTIVFERHSH
jgi:hypothetical protein